MTSPYLAQLCRLFVLIALVSAALPKSLRLGPFATSLADDFRVPGPLSRPLALAVVVTEWAAVAALLLNGPWQRLGAALALLLFVGGSIAMIEALAGGRRVYCQCFGRSTHPVAPIDIGRNLVFIAASGTCLALASSTVPGGWFAQVSLLLAALLCFLVTASLHEISNLLR